MEGKKRGKLAMLGTRLAMAQPRTTSIAPTQSEQRMTGRRLQVRRERVWTNDPACAECGRVTDYPSGFELDHKVPLHQGGADTEANCQVLCSGPDGCHARKTARDLGHKGRQPR